jgi:hypothetical protein
MLHKEELKIAGWKMTAAVVISLSLLIVPTLRAETPPAEVVEAATDGLSEFLNGIPEGELEHFGFSSEDELATATVATPLRVYTISSRSIISFEEDSDVLSVASPTNLWLFPVVCSGEARTILTVDLMEGEWMAVDLGGSSLAAELDQVALDVAQLEAYETRFVRVYRANSDFVLLSKDEVSRLVPLRSAALALGLLERGKTYEYKVMAPSEVLPRLAPVVSRSLRVGQDG